MRHGTAQTGRRVVVKRREIERMTQELADGTLSHEEAQMLQTELAQNAEARQRFRHSMQVEILLMEEIDSLASHGVSGPGASISQKRSFGSRIRTPLLAIAALVALLFAISMLINPTDQSESWECVAVSGASWQINGGEGASNEDTSLLTRGDSLLLESGSLLITANTGARLLVQGPAKLSFPELDRPVLQEGWLWIDTGNSGESFEVSVNSHRVRNIGTRYGIQARRDGQAEVHLMSGVAEVSSHGVEDSQRIEPASTGLLLSAGGKHEKLPLVTDPFILLPQLLGSDSDYRSTILSQGPLAYWMLNEAGGSKMASAVPGTWEATATSETEVGHSSMAAQDGYDGFQEPNRSVYMTGHPLRSIITNIAPPEGMSNREGAMSLWLKPSPSTKRNEIIWLAGESNSASARNPDRSLMHIQIGHKGEMNFFIENGREDILLSSKFLIESGHWHHLVISWSEASAKIYVDGKLADQASGFRLSDEYHLKRKYMRFGKPSGDLSKQGNNPYMGWIDEIAIWGRPLSDAEVEHQYEAALKNP